ncbi:MAG: hypothetical protein Q8L68_03265 [Methylococcales bacterium]|nr:hypothetical protein [Methylococcales bacterium]
MKTEKSAAQIWCRGCRHYDLDGTGECTGGFGLAGDKPPCLYWGLDDDPIKYEPNENGEPNW